MDTTKMTAIKNFFSQFNLHIVKFDKGMYALRYRSLFGYRYLDTSDDDCAWTFRNKHFAFYSTLAGQRHA